MSQRRKRNSSKASLVISFLFHSLVVLGVFYFAARQGVMGDKMKSLVATLEQQKPKEQPKPPKEEPKVEPPKQIDQPKLAATPPPAAQVQTAAAAPPAEAPPAAAPPTLDASFFADGAKAVNEVSDPKLIYKSTIERALRSNWERPEDVNDDEFVAEVELSISPDGNVTASRWVKGSGNGRWDKSVKSAVASTRSVGSAPPAGFPAKFMARFDVEMTRTEDVLKVSSLR
jgi:outer membrane biosynthesis protein TonB